MARPNPPSNVLGPLPLLVFLSGAAGLLHELGWTRLLGQSLGQSLQSLTAVLGAFLLGLAAGALATARAARGAAAPLRIYGRLELGLGAYALASPTIAAGVATAVEGLGPHVADGWPLALLRAALAILAVFPPAALMGATFPMMVGAGALRGATAENAIALLYGLNTLGAAVGAGLGSFLILPCLGTRHAFEVAAAVNLAVGGLALRISPPGAREPARSVSPSVSHPIAPLLAAVLTGSLSALFQVGWTRVAALAFGSTLYALGLTLTAQIVGFGSGPLLAARLLRRRDGPPGSRFPVDPGLLAAGGIGAAGLSTLALLPLVGLLPIAGASLSGLLGQRPLAAFAGQFLIMLLLLSVPTLAQGLAFPGLALLATPGRTAETASGAAYAASTGGMVLGFLLAGLAVVPALGTQKTLAWSAVASCWVAAWLLIRSRPGRLVPLGLVLAAPILAATTARWDPAQMSGGGFLYGPLYRRALGPGRLAEAMRRRGSLLFDEDGADGLVTVRRNPAGSMSLQVNGRTEASTGPDMGAQLLAAHLPLLLHEGPVGRTLLVGLASGVTLGGIEAHPVDSIRVIEIAPTVVRAARLFSDANHRALDDPRVRLVLDDARGALLARPDSYDLIISQPSNPWVAGVANLFTVEFYRLARRRLAPGGLLCQWIQAYRLGPDDLAGLVGAFLQVFPEATLWEESPGGGDYFLIAGERPLRVDPFRWSAVGYAAAWADLARIGLTRPAEILDRFAAGPEALRRLAAGSRPQTDDDLFLEWRAPLSLFRDALRDPLAAMTRARRAPLTLLETKAGSRAPELAGELRALERKRAERLGLLASLRDADLWSLRDPDLAAGLEALRSDRPLDAARSLARAAASNPESATAPLLLAEATRAAGLVAAAEIAYREAIARDAGLAAAWNGLGSCLAARGGAGEARAAFERAVALDPHLAPAYNNLAALLLASEEDRDAERSLRAALSIDPALAAAHANLGLLLRRRGDLEGAERESRAALSLDPVNDDARYNLAVALAGAGRSREARRELEAILGARPGDPGALSALKQLRESGTITGSGKAPGPANPRAPERRTGSVSAPSPP